MAIQRSKGEAVFDAINVGFLVLVAALCLIPLVNVLALSLSSQLAVAQGRVALWPVDLTILPYQYLVKNAKFWNAMGVSFIRIVMGGAINMFLILLTAYPLAKSKKLFPSRLKYVWFFIFTMLFNAGLIPTFFVVKYTGLINTLWALVLPQAVQIFNVILMMNFFRQLPTEMEEAAFIDGASHWQTLLRIYIPTSLPAIATIGLFTIVFHWNEWFAAIIYINEPRLYPLQTYLRSRIINPSTTVLDSADLDMMKNISSRTVGDAQIFVAMIPILLIYPFLQRYFTKGLVLGAVKG
ncbi:MAG: carbohydrate ABC transporter permease [Spirochaetota bacterium]